MPGNTSPLFSRIANMGITTLTTGNSDHTGSGANTVILWTADPTNGGRADSAIAVPLGTNVATVLRIWVNNGGAPSTIANNALVSETTMAATTISEVIAQSVTLVPLALALPAGWRLLAAVSTTIAAGIAVTVAGGSY